MHQLLASERGFASIRYVSAKPGTSRRASNLSAVQSAWFPVTAMPPFAWPIASASRRAKGIRRFAAPRTGLVPPADRTGDSQCGQSAPCRDAVRIALLRIERRRRKCCSRAAGRNANRRLTTPFDDPKPIAADPVHMRIDDGDCRCGGHHRLDRCATGSKDSRPASDAARCGAVMPPFRPREDVSTSFSDFLGPQQRQDRLQKSNAD